ncbi:lipopolysaccharide biosynthesis protein [Mariniblastus sp.]|nr:lipopolysaccharide biosynthesis protein [Mariniblastus sp.]
MSTAQHHPPDNAPGPIPDGEARSASDKLDQLSDSIASGVVFAILLTVGQRVVGFVRGILFCRIMSDQELGQWSMLWSFLMLLAPLAVLGLPGCFSRYTEFYRHRGQLRTFIQRIAVISLTLTMALVVAMAAFPERVSWLIFRDPSHVTIVYALAISLGVVSASNFLSSLLQSLRQVRAVTAMRFITGLAFAVIGTAMIAFSTNRSAAATLAYGISCVLGAIPAIWFLCKYRNCIVDEANSDNLLHSTMWKKIAPFAAWLWVSNLFYNLFEVSDRYMLIHWSETSANIAQGFVGQYHSGRVVPLLLVSVASVVGGLLLPYMSAAWEKGEHDDARRQSNWSVKLLGLAFTAGGIVVLFLSPILFEGIFQGKYNDGLEVLPLTLVYCIWFGLATVAQNYLWVAEKGSWAAIATALGLGANIFLNMLLIPTYGLEGAVIATSLGNAFNLIILYFFNNRQGCQTDLGTWLVSAMPLLLLLPMAFAASAFLAIAIAATTTGFIFTTDEKRDVMEMASKLRK